MAQPALDLRAMVYPEGGEWVAHCLDLDIVSTGPDADTALDQLAEAVSTQLWYTRTHDNFRFLFRPAPPEAWERLGEILKGPHKTIVRSLADHDPEFALHFLLAA